MTTLPVTPIDRPAALNGQSNGRIDAALLTSTPGLAGGPIIKLHGPAARAWQAIAGTAQQAGIILSATSSADSYRTYAQQEATFLARYEPDPMPGYIGTKVWPGHYDSRGQFVEAHRWYQRPNTAVAAVPGYSNHGWGLAVDVANASGARLTWLLANAARFGWSWETQSEPWHIHYFAGDAIPAAVLAYEQGQEDSTMLCKYGDKGTTVEALQRLLLKLDPNCLPKFGPDGGYGDETAAALVKLKLTTGGDSTGHSYGPVEYANMAVAIARSVGIGGGGVVPAHHHVISMPLTVNVTGSGSGTLSGQTGGVTP